MNNNIEWGRKMDQDCNVKVHKYYITMSFCFGVKTLISENKTVHKQNMKVTCVVY
jgi:hypothetical protein